MTDDLGIIVLLELELPLERVSGAQSIPCSIKGVAVDVRDPRYTERQHAELAKRYGLTEDDAECNLDHSGLDVRKVHAAKLQRIKRTEIGRPAPGARADPPTVVFGEIFLVEDDGTIVHAASGSIDHIEPYELFRAEFGEDYDFVLIHDDTASGVPGKRRDIAARLAGQCGDGRPARVPIGS